MSRLMTVIAPAVLFLAWLGLRRTSRDWAGTVVLAALVGLIGVGSWWCFPSQDDWVALASTRSGWFQAQVRWYQDWNGHLASGALNSLLGLIPDPVWATTYGYRLLVAGLWAVFGLVLWDAMGAFFPLSDLKGRLRLSCVIIVAWFLCMPQVNEGIFWLSGALTYLGGAIAVIALAAAVQHARHGRPWRWWLAGLLALIAPLFSEVVAAMVVAVVSVAFCFSSRSDRWRLGLVWLLMMLGFSLLILAPGNAHRIAEAARIGQSIPDHHPFALMAGSFCLGRDFLLAGDWIVPLLAAGWLASAAPVHGKRSPAVLLIMIVAALCAASAAMAWAGMSPLRAWNIPALAVVIALVFLAMQSGSQQRSFINGCVVLASANLVWRTSDDSSALLLLIGCWSIAGFVLWLLRTRKMTSFSRADLIMALLFAFAVGAPRTGELVADVGWRGPAYGAQQVARIQILGLAAPGSRFEVIALHGERPGLIHHDDLGQSPQTWQNQAVATYFGLREVVRIPVERPRPNSDQ